MTPFEEQFEILRSSEPSAFFQKLHDGTYLIVVPGVSLIFGTDEDDDENSFVEWRSFTDQIYQPTAETLRPPALFESRPGPYSWLRRSIRELRHILLGCEAGELETKLVLAAYLMRYARLGLEVLTDPTLEPLALDRHAYALVVAERIVAGLPDNKTPGGSS